MRLAAVAACLPGLAVHALLHHHPVPVIGDDEAMQVEIEAVLHGRAVDLGDQPAGAGQRLTVDAGPFATENLRPWRASAGALQSNPC